MKHTYYPALDGLRTVAVMIVLMAHAHVPFMRSGGVGVDIFFVLSGFLITGILKSELARTGRIHFGSFYWRRMLRLAPCLVLTCILFGLMYTTFRGEIPIAQIGFALTYTANWARGIYGVDMSALGHTWSLAIEEQYYLIWPLIILGLDRALKDPKRIGLALVALALAVAAYRYAMVGTYSSGRIYFGLDTHMDGLVLGSALAYMHRARQLGEAPNAVVRDAMLSWVLAPLAVLALGYVIANLHWQLPQMGQYGYLLAAIASTVLVADLVTSSRTVLGKLLAWAPLVYLGRISYGLYLLHLPLFSAVDKSLSSLPLAIALALKLCLSIVAAVASYHLVEKHFLRLKERWPKVVVASSPCSVLDVDTEAGAATRLPKEHAR